MATVPLSGTNVRIITGVPFTNDYKNTRWFDTVDAQTNYFMNKTLIHSEAKSNFQRIEGYNFIAVNKSIDQLWGANYVMFQNASYNMKWFYGFVTRLEYVQKNTTYVHFEIDVFQTWKFDIEFKPSFVIREHCKLWHDDIHPVINTVDEGLNYGDEYETVSVENYKPSGDVYYLVIVAKKAMHYADGSPVDKITPTNNGIPQPLSYYIHPFRKDGSVPTVHVADTPYEGVSKILDVLEILSINDDAVNNIVSMYVTDFIGYSDKYDSASNTVYFDGDSIGKATIADNESKKIYSLYVKDVPDYVTRTKSFGSKYTGLNKNAESKLWMYPYTLTILDDFKGNRQIIKNEYIESDDLELVVQGSMGTSNKVSYHVKNYLRSVDDLPHERVTGLEYGLINNSANDIPILSDFLSAYLQGNRNSLENQRNSIQFNQLMGVLSAGTSAKASASQGNLTGVQQSVIGGVQGAGNAQLAIEGLNAKQRDIANTPPSLVKMGSNTNYDMGNGIKGVYVIKKQITPEYRRKLTHYFNMFGYKVNEVKVPNFHTRTKWNYVQTESCTIYGQLNNEDLNELKRVFDNGITLWHIDNVGDYTQDNGVI